MARLSDHRREWAAAVATYGAGDIVTTYAGLRSDGVVESHPLSAYVLEQAGVPGMVFWKMGTIGAFALLYGLTPAEYDIGIPVGLTSIGGFVTAVNAATLAVAHSTFSP